MSTLVSPVVPAASRRFGGFTQMLTLDLDALGLLHAPLSVFDDFRVDGLPFSPHPHAGFAAVTYVFEDSPGAVRSRASTGHDLTVGPGGLVWTEAASGAVHEETPAVPGVELHGLQLFVNLTGATKALEPRVLWIDGPDVPRWTDEHGNSVRVVVGSYDGVASPLEPREPFVLLEIALVGELVVPLESGRTMLLYAQSGSVDVVPDEGPSALLRSRQAVGVAGEGSVRLTAQEPARVLVAAGLAIDEPVAQVGPFIMSDAAGVQAAIQRYEDGLFGAL